MLDVFVLYRLEGLFSLQGLGLQYLKLKHSVDETQVSYGRQRNNPSPGTAEAVIIASEWKQTDLFLVGLISKVGENGRAACASALPCHQHESISAK